MSTANKVMEDPSNREKQNRFLNSLQEVLDSLHNIQSVLGTEIDITSEDDEAPPPPHQGSAHFKPAHIPDKSVSVEERMLRRNVKRVHSKPQYIGTLGSKRGQGTSTEQKVRTTCQIHTKKTFSFFIVVLEP